MKTKMPKANQERLKAYVIEETLFHCEYDCDDSLSKESNLIECFRDYVASGILGDLTLEEADEMIASGEITTHKMCKVLLNS